MRLLCLLPLLVSFGTFGQPIDFLIPVAGPTSQYFYTSAAGSGSDCTIGSPCSISTALSSASPSDSVFLKGGDTYEVGGLAISEDVHLKAYGTGTPILTGSTSYSAATWTSEAGGFYSTPLATEPKWIFFNGQAARRGESAWIQITSTPASNQRGANTATLNAFNSVQSLVGAKVRIKELDFRMSYEYTITAYNSGTGVFTVNTTINSASNGYPFKIYNQQQFATTQGDWYWDDATDKLFIKSTTSPSGTDIRVCTQDYAFNVNSSDVSIDGLEFTHYFRTAINAEDADRLHLSNISVHDIRSNGLWLYGNAVDVVVEGFEIYRCGLNGIWFGALQGATIDDGLIHDIGLQSNMPWPLDTYWRKTGGSGIVGADDQNEAIKLPNNITIRNVRIDDVGYQGVSQYGEDWLYENVIVDTFCLKFSDGAGIHTFYRNDFGTGSTTGIVRKCIVRNGIGNRDGFTDTTPVGITGIYIDNGSTDFTIEDCITYENLNYGILVNWNTQNTTIDGGISAFNGYGETYFNENRNTAQSPNYQFNVGNSVIGHTMAADDTRPLLWGASYNDATSSYTTTYNPFVGGTIDNNIYFRPMSVNVAVIQTGGLVGNPNVATFNSYSLANWRTYTGGDAASVVYSNFATTEIKIYVNDTNAPVLFNPGSGYKYMDGSSFTSATFQPFEGVVYYK